MSQLELIDVCCEDSLIKIDQCLYIDRFIEGNANKSSTSLAIDTFSL